MTLDVKLLGIPSLERNGAPTRLGGRKPWVLLAMLVLDQRPIGRAELIDRLTADADDPQAALRWLLHMTRRAVGPELRIVEIDGRLQLERSADARIDVLELLATANDPEAVDAIASGELLEGMQFDDAPLAALWLSMERSRLNGALAEGLWWAATTIASVDVDRSLRLVRRGLSIDPYCETKHELMIDLHLQRGDVLSARAHAEAATRIFRDELGIEPTPSIRRPLLRREPGVPAAASARALLQAADARFAAGDPAGAVEIARRAADAALRAGDSALELDSLLLLARILIHAARGSEVEAKGLLSRAAQLATDRRDAAALADVEREMAYVAIIEGNYGAADPLLARSMALASDIGDRHRWGQAATYQGIAHADRSNHEAAITILGEAIETFDGIGDAGWLGYAEAMLARTLAWSGDLAGARVLARRARPRIHTAGWMTVLPWPMLVEGECLLAGGDLVAAGETFNEALALGVEIGDHCLESLAIRGLGLLKKQAGDRAGAMTVLERALRACRRTRDAYTWVEAVILVDLVELGEGRDRRHVEAAYTLTVNGQMRDLATRVIRAAATEPSQTLAQTASA